MEAEEADEQGWYGDSLNEAAALAAEQQQERQQEEAAARMAEADREADEREARTLTAKEEMALAPQADQSQDQPAGSTALQWCC